MGTPPPSQKKKGSVYAFIVALALFVTGVIALPAGLILLFFAQEYVYGLGSLAYGVVAVGVAMFGSDRSVFSIAGLPERFK